MPHSSDSNKFKKPWQEGLQANGSAVLARSAPESQEAHCGLCSASCREQAVCTTVSFCGAAWRGMVRQLIAEPPGEWSPALSERVNGPLLCDRIGSEVLDQLETFLQDEALLQKAADLSNGSV